MPHLPIALVGLAFAGVALTGCSPSPAPASEPAPPAPDATSDSAPDPIKVEVDALRQWEDATRQRTDFTTAATWDQLSGPDPFALLRWERAGVIVGLLRGQDEAVVLDPATPDPGNAFDAPASPTALAQTHQGELLIGGEGSPEVWRYTVDAGGAISRAEPWVWEGALGIRALAWGDEGVLYLADPHRHKIGWLRPGVEGAARQGFQGTCHAPIGLVRAGGWLVVGCALEHEIVAWPVDDHGVPQAEGAVRFSHDGPLWGFDAIADGAGLIIAAGGVEDRPLERRDGSFGYIDSFLYLYQSDGLEMTRRWEVNLSESGVVTPRQVSLRRAGPRLEVTVAPYGSDRLALVEGAPQQPPSIKTRPGVPGLTAMVALDGGAWLGASPLLDTWVRLDEALPGGWRMTPAGPLPPGRSASSRVGEALFFTNLLAPWNGTEGRASRFTCETCHFEGYVDGRVHHTGRGEVRVSSRPLAGLFNNRPHFSRALDKTMARMVHAEFRVANAGSGRDPWYAHQRRDWPWLADVEGVPEVMDPVWLRRAFMTFLMDHSHRPNPRIAGRQKWNTVEREGARIFAQRCERCHAARLVTDDPASAVPFERWEALVFSPQGPIVWAREGYEKTGVTPYVHAEGTRTPTLRRLDRKWPYLTDGSATTLEAVLGKVAWDDARFWHGGAPAEGEVERLDDASRAALRAFLELL